MSKAFTKESDADDEDDGRACRRCPPARQLHHPAGLPRLRDELMALLDVERPKVVEMVSWAAEQRRPLGERRLPLRQEAACARSTAASAS